MKKYIHVSILISLILYSCTGEEDLEIIDPKSSAPCFDYGNGCIDEGPIDLIPIDEGDGGSSGGNNGGNGGSTGGSGTTYINGVRIDNENFGLSLSRTYDFPSAPPNCNDLVSVAKYYAPIVWFHKDEKYFPSNIDWYLNRVDLITEYQLKAKYNTSNSFVIIDGTTPNLNSPTKNNLDSYHQWGRKWIQSTFFYEEFDIYSNIHGGGTWGMRPQNGTKAGRLRDARAYVHFEKKRSGALHIQYWIFYPFNGGGIGWHEGDWEHITIALNADCTINAVNFDEHGNTQWTKDLQFSGSHVYAYSAKERHAFYKSKGSKRTSPYSEDSAGEGMWWNTKNYLEIAWDRTNKTGISRANWTKYTGEWGLDAYDIHFLVSFHPPNTPSFKWADDPNPFE